MSLITPNMLMSVTPGITQPRDAVAVFGGRDT